MFVFCKQKTAYEMRISDWSSDVCSSDPAEASRLSGARRLRRLVPEVHDEIGAAGNVRAGLPDRLGVAVAQLLPDVLAADEGRVADDELRLRPTRRTRVLVGAQLAPPVLVRHRFPGPRVPLGGASC